MVFLSNWQKDLSPKEFSILIILFIFIFIFYEFILLSRLSAERCSGEAAGYLKKSRSLGKDIVIEKSVLYYKGLRVLGNSIAFNPLDSRFYFEYAEAVVEAAEDSQLSSLLEMGSLGQGETRDMNGFYDLAKTRYVEAISRDPVNAIYHQRLGRVYDKLSDTKKAEEEFKAAVLLSPQSIMIHIYLSQYFLSRNKEAEFLYHIKKAISIQTLTPGAYVSGDLLVFIRSIGREDLIKK